MVTAIVGVTMLTGFLLGCRFWPIWRDHAIERALAESHEPPFWWPASWREELNSRQAQELLGDLSAVTISLFATNAPIPTPTECPNGHTSLKNIPIQYGLLLLDTDSAKENLIFWPGGCVIRGDDPKWKTVCAECRYAYDERWQEWEREARTHEGFKPDLCGLIVNFPVIEPSAQIWKLEYGHEIRGANARREHIAYGSASTSRALEQEIRRYLVGYGIELSENDSRPEWETARILVGKWNHRECELRLDSSYTGSEMYIAFWLEAARPE